MFKQLIMFLKSFFSQKNYRSGRQFRPDERLYASDATPSKVLTDCCMYMNINKLN
jgi:hypothetical protein